MTTAVEEKCTEPSAFAELLTDAIEQSHRSMTRCKAELLTSIRAFEEGGFAPQMGARTTAQFLTRRLGISISTAHEYVHVGCRLGEFLYLQQQFSAGKISYSVVRLLLRYLTPAVERQLVDMALELGYHELEIALSGYDKPGNGDSEKPDHYLRVHTRDNGEIALHGVLNATDGAAFIAALKLGEIAYYEMEEMLEDALRHEDGRVAELSIRDMLQKADAVEPAKKARKTASGYGMPIGRMLLQAFMGMVHMTRSQPKSALTTPGAHVNVLVTKDGRAYMPNNVGARSEALVGLIANADLRVSTVDDDGLIINTGRSSRFATPGQVNALLTMWGGQCAAPGCTHSRFIEIHHIKEWSEGGMTDLENLLPLCSACHSLVTDGYLETVKDGSDVHFIYQDGTRYISDNYSLPRRRDNAQTWAESGGGFDD